MLLLLLPSPRTSGDVAYIPIVIQSKKKKNYSAYNVSKINAVFVNYTSSLLFAFSLVVDRDLLRTHTDGVKSTSDTSNMTSSVVYYSTHARKNVIYSLISHN